MSSNIHVFLSDDPETAINIGYSCQLLTDDMVDVFIIDGLTKAEVEQQLRKYMESLRIVNTYHPTSECPLFWVSLQHDQFYQFHHITALPKNTLNQNSGGGGLTTGPTANGGNSGSSGPMIEIQNSSPPSVSVVTFRWDNRHKYTSIGGSEEASDRYNTTTTTTDYYSLQSAALTRFKVSQARWEISVLIILWFLSPISSSFLFNCLVYGFSIIMSHEVCIIVSMIRQRACSDFLSCSLVIFFNSSILFSNNRIRNTPRSVYFFVYSVKLKWNSDYLSANITFSRNHIPQ